MTEKALETVRQIKFVPAEKDWHTVSQRMRFEFLFNDSGVDAITAEEAEGRNVEAIEIVGNRRLRANEIMSLIQTRPGDLCREQQIKKDLERILATGYFDSRGTRIQTEKGASGGVVIVIEVQELPLISEIKFQGLKGVDESLIFEALRKSGIDMRQGQVYDPVKVKRAISIIRNLLASNKQPGAVVEIRTEETTASSVVLTFVISGK
jgi:outer membrane protein assembly factor BamA